MSFNCTHFGYSMEFWKKAFASRGVEVEAFLDPNTKMIDFMLPTSLHKRFPQSEITVKIVSMIDIPEENRDSLGRYLHTISPATETALQHYEKVPGLFEWQQLVSVWGETSLWLGWVVPGLIGADVQRQDVIPTLTGVVSVSIATAMAVQLLQEPVLNC